MIQNEDSQWLRFDENRNGENAAMRVFCFHYAGAGASMFEPWADSLRDQAELVAIQLPGREDRFSDPLVSDLRQIARDVTDDLGSHLDRPFALFGHSIGALICFELARILRRRGLRGPELLIVSGQNAPQVERKVRTVHELPDEEFIQVLRDYGGTPEIILQHEDLLELLLPRLRSDIAISETYHYETEEPLTCPIVALYSTGDALVNEGAVLGWEAQTRSGFRAYSFPGDHFFLHTAEDSVLDRLRSELKRTGEALAASA